MHRTVGRLCGDVLVQRVPGNTLDVVTVLGDLPDQVACGVSERVYDEKKQGRRTCSSVVYTRYVVHAADDEKCTVGRPREVVDFRSAGPAHVLCAPRLLVLERFRSEMVTLVVLGRHPENNVAIVASRGKQLA